MSKQRCEDCDYYLRPESVAKKYGLVCWHRELGRPIDADHCPHYRVVTKTKEDADE